MRTVRSLVPMLVTSLMLGLASSPALAGTGGFFGEFTPDGGIDAAPAVPEPAAFLLFVAGGLIVGGALLRRRR